MPVPEGFQPHVRRSPVTARVLEAQGRAPERGLVTTSLSVDYLGRAELGRWLEVDTAFVHAGRSQGVTQAFVTADGAVIARANAAFRIG